MKKFYLILAIVTATVLIFTACNETTTDPKDVVSDCYTTVKPQQKLCTENGYKSINQYTTDYVDGVLDESSMYLYKTGFFNSSGYIDSTIYFNEDGSLDYIDVVLRTQYNDIYGWKEYYPGESAETNIYCEYEYNGKGLMTKKMDPDGWYGYMKYSYNSDDLLSIIEVYDMDDRYTKKVEMFYDGCSKPNKGMITYFGDGTIDNYELEYDKFGNISRITIVNQDGTRESENTNEIYDANGRLVEEWNEDSDDWTGTETWMGGDDYHKMTYSYNSDNLLESSTYYGWDDFNSPAALREYVYNK